MAEERRRHPIHRPPPPTLDAQSSQSSHLFGACLVLGIGSGQRLIEIAVFYPDGNKGAQEGKGLWATRLRSLLNEAQVFAQRDIGLCPAQLRSLLYKAWDFAQRGIGLCSTRHRSLDTSSLFGRIWHPFQSNFTSGFDTYIQDRKNPTVKNIGIYWCPVKSC